jgi:ribosome biogenesis GTPase
VVRVERQHSIVVGDDGVDFSAVSMQPPAVGDWVVLDEGVVRQTLPRWSELTRLDPDGDGLQTLASNIDVVLIVAPADRLSHARVERELVVAWESGARPIVVLTKGDLAEPDTLNALRERLVGTDVIMTSVKTGDGVAEVRACLRPDLTAVLLGPSGGGKSSLANAVLGSDALATGDVRENDRRGRHTTASRQLVAVAGGGVLIDTPGLRSLGLGGSGGIDSVFPEIEELASLCRFSDCHHDSEPGCAVTQAISDGRLEIGRFTSFLKLQREGASMSRRVDPLKRKEQLRIWKARTKANRNYDKRRLK